MEHNQQSFWQFSDQLRLQTANLANLSTNDSIWSNSYDVPRRKNNSFDVRVGAELSSSNSKPKVSSDLNAFNDGWNSFKPSGTDLLNSNLNLKPQPVGLDNFKDVLSDGWNSFKPKTTSDYNGFNDGWKINSGPIMGNSKEIGANGAHFSKGLYYKLGTPANNANFNFKSYKNGGGSKGEEAAEYGGGKIGKKSKVKNGAAENGNNDGVKSAVEKRFKTLPPAESLPRNEMIGGYIFVCNNDTMQENLRRQLFGLPPRYRDSVRAITPGLPLFLYNYSTHQLHGIFEAASFGGSNIDPTAWEDKKCPGESRFPAQVRVITRKICVPLEEDSFRPILHHYDGPKFRLELSIPEAISLLDVLAHQNP